MEILEIFKTVFGQSKLNFKTVFGQFELNFWDCFQTVRTGFPGLFYGSLGLSSGLVLISGLMSTSFVVSFWYHSNSVTNHEGTKRCPVLYGSEIWAILCVIVGKY